MMWLYGLGLMSLLAAFCCDCRRQLDRCYRMPSDEEDSESHTDVETGSESGKEN